MADPNPGTVHVMEQEMINAGTGVFEGKPSRESKSEPKPAPTSKKAPVRSKAKAKK